MNSSKAQYVKWNEPFDSISILDRGWKIVNNDSGAFALEFYKPYLFYGIGDQDPQAGNYFLKMSFENVNDFNHIDDWVITPRLMNIEQGDSIFFWCGAVDRLYKDSLKIWISTTDNNLNSFNQIDYFKVNGPVGTWHKKGYDLSAYAGQNIYFAVNYYIWNAGAMGTASDVVWIDHFMMTSKTGPAEIASYQLAQNFPNPFNPSTEITFSVPGTSIVNIKIYDVAGRDLMTLINGSYSKGKYNVRFDASNLASGVYFYKMSATNSTTSETIFTETKKMELIK